MMRPIWLNCMPRLVSWKWNGIFLKKLVEARPMSKRLHMIDSDGSLSIRKQCDLLSVTRGTFYYKAVGESEENLRIMRLMDE